MDAVLVALIMAVILGVPLGLIVWGLVRSYRRRNQEFELSLPVSSQGSNAAGRNLAVLSPLMGAWGFQLASQGEAGLVFSKTYRPVWLLVPCLLFFPLGLLSLLYRRTVDVSFSLLTGSDGDRLAISGRAPAQLQVGIVERLSAQVA